MKFSIAIIAATIAIIPVAARRNRRSKACKDIDVDIASLTLKVKGLSNQDTIQLFSVNDITAFGDSLTDIGNANKDFPCTVDEVYCGDRNSNGALIIDYIASDLNVPLFTGMLPGYIPSGGNNYAVSDAVAGNDGFRPPGNDFREQRIVYGKYLSLIGSPPSPNNLHFISFGQNDIKNAFAAKVITDAGTSGGGGDLIATTTINKAVNDMQTNMEELISFGACSFLVLGALDIGLSPLVALTAQALGVNLGKTIQTATDLTLSFNTKLQSMLDGLEVSTSDGCLGIQYVDTMNATIDGILADEDYNIAGSSNMFNVQDLDLAAATCNNCFFVPCEQCKNVLKAAYQDNYDPNLGYTQVGNTTDCLCNLPALQESQIEMNCTGKPFYDELHPATKFANFISNAVMKYTREELGLFLIPESAISNIVLKR